MLLTNIQDVTPGMKVGSLIVHPQTPDLVLLKPGAELSPHVIDRLHELRVTHLWVEHESTGDLDWAVPEALTLAKVEAYRQFKSELRKAAPKVVTTEQANVFRDVVAALVAELAASREHPGLTDQLFMADSDLLCHGVNVASIALLVGQEMLAYTLRQRHKRSGRRASDEVELGLGALLHDIGKMDFDGAIAGHHEIHPEDSLDVEAYRHHVDVGYGRLQGNAFRPIVRSIVLNHHQRYDGSGWPDLAAPTRGRRRGRPDGRRIHVFSRIVAAANVLDNLLRRADGSRRPPVAALSEFAGPRFDGWFDPIVRRAVVRHVPPFVVGSRVDLADGRAAVVVSTNVRQPCRPTVRTLVLPGVTEGAPAPAVLDLEERGDLSIARYAGEDVAQWLYSLPSPEASRRQSA